MTKEDVNKYWETYHTDWSDQQGKLFNMIKELKSTVDVSRAGEEDKRKIKGIANSIGKWILEYGKIACEQELREIALINRVGEINDEIKVLRRIAMEALNVKK